MQRVENVAFLVSASEDIAECVRAALGLAVDMFTVGVFVIDAAINKEQADDELLDRLELIADLDGSIYSNTAANKGVCDHIRIHTLQELAGLMAAHDLVVTF